MSNRALCPGDIVAFRADAVPIMREVFGFGEEHVACTLSSIHMSAIGKKMCLLTTPWREQLVEVFPSMVHLWSNPAERSHLRMIRLQKKILRAQESRREEKQCRNAKRGKKTING